MFENRNSPSNDNPPMKELAGSQADRKPGNDFSGETFSLIASFDGISLRVTPDLAKVFDSLGVPISVGTNPNNNNSGGKIADQNKLK